MLPRPSTHFFDALTAWASLGLLFVSLLVVASSAIRRPTAKASLSLAVPSTASLLFLLAAVLSSRVFQKEWQSSLVGAVAPSTVVPDVDMAATLLSWTTAYALTAAAAARRL